MDMIFRKVSAKSGIFVKIRRKIRILFVKHVGTYISMIFAVLICRR